MAKILPISNLQKNQARLDLYEKLAAAETEVENGEAAITHKELFQELRSRYNVK